LAQTCITLQAFAHRLRVASNESYDEADVSDDIHFPCACALGERILAWLTG